MGEDGVRERKSAEAYWGAHAREYDEFIVRVVPRYREQLDRLIDYAPGHAMRVLELGCGSGNASLRLAARWPHAEFTFVDGAPEMLELTEHPEEPRVYDRATQDPFIGQVLEAFETERMVVVPLWSGKRLWGIVIAAWAADPPTVSGTMTLRRAAPPNGSLVGQRLATLTYPGGVWLIAADGVTSLTSEESRMLLASAPWTLARGEVVVAR